MSDPIDRAQQRERTEGPKEPGRDDVRRPNESERQGSSANRLSPEQKAALREAMQRSPEQMVAFREAVQRSPEHMAEFLEALRGSAEHVAEFRETLRTSPEHLAAFREAVRTSPTFDAEFREAVRASPEDTAAFREAVRSSREESAAFMEALLTSPERKTEFREASRTETLRKHPPLFAAIKADARAYLDSREEHATLESSWDLIKVVAHLSWETDVFLGLLLYRVRACFLRRRIPVLPNLIHHICMMGWQLCIGQPVVIFPGVCFLHGQAVIDGGVEIGSGTVIAPWVTIGLRQGDIAAPKLGNNVFVGTGAKLLGPIEIGSGAIIGANAVVIHDVEPNTLVVGVPARPIKKQPTDESH